MDFLLVVCIGAVLNGKKLFALDGSILFFFYLDVLEAFELRDFERTDPVSENFLEYSLAKGV
jgi:hypothetical protein